VPALPQVRAQEHAPDAGAAAADMMFSYRPGRP
jgi:hypothetical protein